MATSNHKIIKSPLNYIGGKTRLLKQILPLLPGHADKFVDLFAGGCNVGINANANKIFFNDNLTYLIELYQCFHGHEIEDLIAKIEKRISHFDLSKTNVDGYNAARREYNNRKNPIDLFVLIAFSFNHQIRFNNKHEFNVPLGKDRSSFNSKMKANLIDFVQRLKETDAVFSNKDFCEFDFKDLSANDFVYCDPPYLITTGSYNDGRRGFKGWTEKEENGLLAKLDELNDRGVPFALSNVIEHKGKRNEILAQWLSRNRGTLTQSILNMDYKNSNYQTNKLPSVEVLITNYNPSESLPKPLI